MILYVCKPNTHQKPLCFSTTHIPINIVNHVTTQIAEVALSFLFLNLNLLLLNAHKVIFEFHKQMDDA